MPQWGDGVRFAFHRLWTGLVMALAIVALVDLAGPYVLDPSVLLMGDAGSGGELQRVRASLGLDQPWWMRIAHGLGALFGFVEANSYRFGIPVSELIGERWQATVLIMVWALVTAILGGVVVGVASARWYWVRAGVLRAWSALLVLPAFVAAGWAASQPSVLNWGVPGEVLGGGLLGLYGGIWVAQSIQASVASERQSWHVKALQSLGMPRATLARAITRGVLHQALGTLDLFAAVLLTGGTVVVEFAFHIEGLGLLLLDSLLVMDIPVVRALLAMALAGYLLVSTAILLLRGLIDPRIWIAEK